jgi:hypothetical protein
VVLDLAGIGLFSGFFVVPLFALIQSRTPKDELSRVIAGMNIQNASSSSRRHWVAWPCSSSWAGASRSCSWHSASPASWWRHGSSASSPNS